MPRQVPSALQTTLRHTLAVALLGSLATWHTSSLADSADTMALKMSEAVAPDRFFVRAGAISVNIKTKSGDTYDVTGPVLTRAQLLALRSSSDATILNYIKAKGFIDTTTNPTLVTLQNVTTSVTSLKNNKIKGLLAIVDLMDAQTPKITQIGTPKGVKAVAADKVGTGGLSLGYFLDDEYKWVVETYVLAKPVNVYVTADGPATARTNADGADELGRFSIAGQKILTSKLLPPTLMLGRYWGDKDAKFRPFTGLIAMYAMMYDTKATDLLNSYVGGGNPGDTTVSFKNTFGIGPMLGVKYQINDQWHLSLNVGSVKLKTQGTIVTRNSDFTKSTGAIQDLGPLTSLLVQAEKEVGTAKPGASGGALGQILDDNPQIGGISGLITKSLAYANGQDNLGTFVRKANTTLDSTIFMMSVGHSF